uniref:Pectin acetylesterase n=1 Tax=Kalanchoe fedtschenkoi TaxID=63787 RepID=A0A7N0T5J2_KALFE
MAIAGSAALGKKLAKRDWAIAIAGFAAFIFLLSTFTDFAPVNRLPTPPPATAPDLVDLTLSRVARARAAYCLDGSVPGYHFRKGSGSGARSWILHIEGGGWCDSVESCSFRKTTALGSSDFMDPRVPFSGILSSDEKRNPDFHSWNKVKIRYCDGASLAGVPESELKLGNSSGLFFRGRLIWESLMEEFLSMGLSSAKQAILSGCSAGALATLIHCDGFREMLPDDATVKCVSDAGFFLNEKDVTGSSTMESFYGRVVSLQGLAKSLPKECTARSEASTCLFPREIIPTVKTPVFVVNPAYDFWQIQNVLVPSSKMAFASNWFKCRQGLRYCDPDQVAKLQEFRNSLLNALSDFQKHHDEGGMFVNSCYIHCQTWMGETWHSPSSPRIDGRTIAEAVGDWFFNRRAVKLIDCAYPCNPTCYHMDFTKRG